jgi:hypothetical protein
MKISSIHNERDLKLLLRSFESKWMKAISAGDKRVQAQALSEVRFEINRLMDNFEKLQQEEDGNNFIYRRLLNKIKRWARAMEGRLK